MFDETGAGWWVKGESETGRGGGTLHVFGSAKILFLTSLRKCRPSELSAMMILSGYESIWSGNLYFLTWKKLVPYKGWSFTVATNWLCKASGSASNKPELWASTRSAHSCKEKAINTKKKIGVVRVGRRTRKRQGE